MSYSSSDPPCFSVASPELKLYQAFIFSVPIFFTIVLLLLFYLFYLRRRRADWSSLRMRSLVQPREANSRASDSGLRKELREMLPIIIFKESFMIRETQCSVCLGDYQANDQLQQIPSCGHTFHMDCIDLWLASNTTCPLCRMSLLPSPKANCNPVTTEDTQHDERRRNELSSESNEDGILLRNEGSPREERIICNSNNSEGEELRDMRRDEQIKQCECEGEGSSFVVDVEPLVSSVGDRV